MKEEDLEEELEDDLEDEGRRLEWNEDLKEWSVCG